jgi:hypothetical protein
MSSIAHRLLAPAVLALAATAASAAGPVPVLKFDRGIGVDPLTAAGGVDVSNVVRGINPGGRAWVIHKLNATIYSDGSIVARGKGLLFSSGEAIATRGAVAQVVATLACGPANATAVKYTSEPTPLNAAGNFNLQGTLRDSDGNVAPLASTPCDNPQLLIRSSPAGGWFAAGILDRDD